MVTGVCIIDPMIRHGWMKKSNIVPMLKGSYGRGRDMSSVAHPLCLVMI